VELRAPFERSGGGNFGSGTDGSENGSAKPQPFRFYERAACRASRILDNWYLGRFSCISRGESAAILSLIVWTEFERGCGVAQARIQGPQAAARENRRSQQMRIDPANSFAKKAMLFEKFQHLCVFG